MVRYETKVTTWTDPNGYIVQYTEKNAYCPKCHGEANEGYPFCPYCGAPLTYSDTEMVGKENRWQTPESSKEFIEPSPEETTMHVIKPIEKRKGRKFCANCYYSVPGDNGDCYWCERKGYEVYGYSDACEDALVR